MSATPPPGYTPPPADLPQRGDRATFSNRVDAWVTWFSTVILTQLAAMIANAYTNALSAFASATTAAADAATAAASAISAMASANVVVWVSGTTYSQYSVVVSPITKIAYRKVSTSTGGTTDPSLDTAYTNWKPLYGPGDHEVIVSGVNGTGSTNTAIRRFTTVVRNIGSDITYSDSAANGAAFTINATGLYSLYTVDGNAVNSPVGVSVNSTTLSTPSSTATGVVCITISGAGARVSSSRTMRLVAGDVVRAHVSSGSTGSAEAMFSIVRVG